MMERKKKTLLQSPLIEDDKLQKSQENTVRRTQQKKIAKRYTHRLRKMNRIDKNELISEKIEVRKQRFKISDTILES